MRAATAGGALWSVSRRHAWVGRRCEIWLLLKCSSVLQAKISEGLENAEGTPWMMHGWTVVTNRVTVFEEF